MNVAIGPTEWNPLAAMVERPMSLVERASNALSKAEVETRIKELVESSKAIVAVVDPASREVCHDSLMVLKNMRIETQKRAKVGRDEAVQYSKVVIAIERELVALIEPEETRLAKIRDDWDAIKEREREAKIQLEVQRVTLIQERIAELRGCQTLSPTSGAGLIMDHINDLERIQVDDSFAEFQQQAGDVKATALLKLWKLHVAAVEHQAEQERIKLERAELAKLRAEQEERERVAKAERDYEESLAQAKRNAEREEEIARARVHAEELRQAREVLDAENKRLADDRAKLAAEQEALRIANLPKPKPRKAPTGMEIVEVIAKHYGVTEKLALQWVLKIDWGFQVKAS